MFAGPHSIDRSDGKFGISGRGMIGNLGFSLNPLGKLEAVYSGHPILRHHCVSVSSNFKA
jgi:hypothetical protein